MSVYTYCPSFILILSSGTAPNNPRSGDQQIGGHTLIQLFTSGQASDEKDEYDQNQVFPT